MQAQSVLVVDDEPDMRTALTQTLKRTGFSVEAASNGFEALEKFKRDVFSVVITDMKMPEMSGLEVLEGVKKMSPQVPVIMITAYGTISNAVEAMKEGAADYIIKPFSSETLDAAVEKACMSTHVRHPTKPLISLKKYDSPIRIITRDSEFLKVMALAKNVASTNATILILGESGTGKELIASFIHQVSGQKGHYVPVNCAALPESLAESELFGHEKGAFTGAIARKTGKFEFADHGTILLDEISEMSLQLQAKLLRVLQEREIIRVGGNKSVPIDTRVIAVSNVDLKKAVKEGKFREDLFYRINVIPLTIPPLRERKEDIILLANYFLEKYCSENNKKMKKISDETTALLLENDWKGNVRELENTIERAVIMGKGDALLPEHLYLEDAEKKVQKIIPVNVGISVREMERELISHTLEKVDGNRTHAARMLGISIRTLRNKLKEYKGNAL